MNMYDPNYIPKEVLFMLVIKTVIYDDDNRILLIQRSDKTPRAHGWDLPGGGVDSGENPPDAAIRETLEETGLQVNALESLTTYHGQIDKGEYVAIGYAAHVTTHDIQLSWEHESYRWMTLDEVTVIDLPPMHRTIVDAFIDAKRTAQTI